MSDKWIDIAKQKPKSNQVAFAWDSRFKTVLKGRFERGATGRLWFDTAEFEDEPNVFVASKRITHWMPLPTPPNTTEER